MDLSKDALSQEVKDILTDRQPAGAWYRVGQITVNLLKHLMFHWDIAYHAPMPNGAKLLVSNHPTTIDPILMIALVPEQMRILITEVLFKVPVVGASLRQCKQIRVDRANGRPAVEQAVQALKDGETLGIFPEGIISPAKGGLEHFHSGAARLALASGVPVVPVGIAVQRENVWRTQSLIDGQPEVGAWYTSGIYAVTVGEPLVFSGSADDRARVQQVTAELADRVLELSLESAHRLAALRVRRPVFFVRWLRLVFAG